MESNDQKNNKSVLAMEIHGTKARFKLTIERRIYKSMAVE
jgi:hypothetical protein